MSKEAITQALLRAEGGEAGAAEDLWQLVYADLKQIAAARLARMPAGGTLAATALVHEAWMKLQSGRASGWESRAHFFGAAARSMRNILVDQARRRRSQRRDPEREESADAASIAAEAEASALDMLALDEALDALQAEHDRPARIVMLRFFAGLSLGEIAELLEVTTRTVDRDLLFARTWLRRFMDQAN